MSAPPVSATRIASDREDYITWMKGATHQMVELGYDEAVVKGYIWNLYKTKGIAAVRQWVESELASHSKPESASESANVAVDTQTGEIVANTDPTAPEIELSDEDMPFPGEQ